MPSTMGLLFLEKELVQTYIGLGNNVPLKSTTVRTHYSRTARSQNVRAGPVYTTAPLIHTAGISAITSLATPSVNLGGISSWRLAPKPPPGCGGNEHEGYNRAADNHQHDLRIGEIPGSGHQNCTAVACRSRPGPVLLSSRPGSTEENNRRRKVLRLRSIAPLPTMASRSRK